MDLSHLVTIGLCAAKRKPLTNADLEYFKQHGVDEKLAEVVDQLAQLKPADPFKFIVDVLSGVKPSAVKAPAQKPAAPVQKAAPAATAPAAKAVAKPAPAPPRDGKDGPSPEIVELSEKIKALKDKLKSEGVEGKDMNSNPEVAAMVSQLKKLREGDAKSGDAKKDAKKDDKKDNKKDKPAATKEVAVASKQQEKGGGLTIKKLEDVPEWYAQVVMKAELIEQYPVKGCFILRPWAYGLWEQIQRWFDAEIKKIQVENCYFPMFIPRCYLEKEEDHLDDFAPEMAWVSKFGDQDIEEPVAIRPTSETAMYAAYSNWVQSHRDLPLKLNQWCSVVRWEVKQTTPFLRTREFLWQEGHTAHVTKKSATDEVYHILELYALVYEKLMAIPVVRGTKTKAETFPGADFTTTVEAFIPATGRAIQGATSHHLGQNFSKMFDISFQDPSDSTGKKREFAHQNSWGITQRTIGVCTMVHGDDRGLVLPPLIATMQVLIVQVGVSAKTTDAEKQELQNACERYYKTLQEAGIRVVFDESPKTPGMKFNYWEMKGVPLRIELGPKDLEKKTFMMAKRNCPPTQAAKISGSDATLVADVQKTLEAVQSELYDKALKERDERMVFVDEWKDFSPNLNEGKLILVPFCGAKECEEMIKAKSKEEAADVEVAGGLKMGAKSLCVPLEEKYNPSCPATCINPDCPTAGKKAGPIRTMFGRSY